MGGTRPRLTEPQRRVWRALGRRSERGEPLPTYRELCAEFGWSSTATARDHLQALARKGYIDLPQGRARAIRVKGHLGRKVPLLGSVAAGTPVVTEEVAGGSIDVPPEWLTQGRHFAVRVSGDSMKDAGILDGDNVIAKVQNVADDGDIVVATIDGETTLKRLRRRGTRWWLVPENQAYHAIRILSESVVIQGVMVGLVRGDLLANQLHFENLQTSVRR